MIPFGEADENATTYRVLSFDGETVDDQSTHSLPGATATVAISS